MDEMSSLILVSGIGMFSVAVVSCVDGGITRDGRGGSIGGCGGPPSVEMSSLIVVLFELSVIGAIGLEGPGGEGVGGLGAKGVNLHGESAVGGIGDSSLSMRSERSGILYGIFLSGSSLLFCVQKIMKPVFCHSSPISLERFIMRCGFSVNVRYLVRFRVSQTAKIP